MEKRNAWIIVAAFLLAPLACDRDAGAPGHRVDVALPQWFHPSEERPWLQRAWQEISAAHPEGRVDLQLLAGRTEQIFQKLLVLHAAGQEPDLACIKMHWMRPLVERGLLKPLDGWIPEACWARLVPALRASTEIDGTRYLLPYDVGVRVILYRDDLFEEAGIRPPETGWTWEAFLAAARKLTVDQDGDGVTDRWGFGIPGARSEKTVFQWLPWFWSLGGRFQEADGMPLSLCTPEAVRALQWYDDLANRHGVTPRSFYSMDQEAVFQGLAGGLFAMTEGGSWEPALLKRFSPHASRIRLALLPDPGPGTPSVTLMDGWGFAVLSDDPQKRPILSSILTTLSSLEHQIEKYRAARTLSPFEDVYGDPRFRSDASAGVLTEAVRRARPLPGFVSFPWVAEGLEMALQDVLVDGADPGKSLEAQARQISARMRGRRKPDAAVPGEGPPPGTDDPKAHAGTPPASQVPPGALRVVVPGKEGARLLAPDELRRLERSAVGDMLLIPLASLCPEDVPVAGVTVLAADGYEKRIPASRLGHAYLDPERMSVVLAKGAGGTFTARDVVELSIQPAEDAQGLAIVSARETRLLSADELLSLAGDRASIAFHRLVERTGVVIPAGSKVRLVARDGYTREVPAGRFLEGRLHLDGMRCAFPGLSSKDQVTALKRIELP